MYCCVCSKFIYNQESSIKYSLCNHVIHKNCYYSFTKKKKIIGNVATCPIPSCYFSLNNEIDLESTGILEDRLNILKPTNFLVEKLLNLTREMPENTLKFLVFFILLTYFSIFIKYGI